MNIIKLDHHYEYGESIVSQEKAMYCEVLIDAIDALESRDRRERKEAIDFIFKSDMFDDIFDMAISLEIDPETAKQALRKRIENGKSKNHDGRRIKAATSSNNDKHTGITRNAETPFRFQSIFAGAND